MREWSIIRFQDAENSDVGLFEEQACFEIADGLVYVPPHKDHEAGMIVPAVYNSSSRKFFQTTDRNIITVNRGNTMPALFSVLYALDVAAEKRCHSCGKV